MPVPLFEQAKIVTATSTTISSVVDLADKTVEAIVVGDITGTALRFQGALPNSVDPTQPSSTWYDIYTSAGASVYEVTIADNRWIDVDHNIFAAVRWLRLVFQTAQGADLTVNLVINRVR